MRRAPSARRGGSDGESRTARITNEHWQLLLQPKEHDFERQGADASACCSRACRLHRLRRAARAGISLNMQKRNKARNFALITDILLAERLQHELLLARDAHEEDGPQYQQCNKYSAESSHEH